MDTVELKDIWCLPFGFALWEVSRNISAHSTYCPQKMRSKNKGQCYFSLKKQSVKIKSRMDRKQKLFLLSIGGLQKEWWVFFATILCPSTDEKGYKTKSIIHLTLKKQKQDTNLQISRAGHLETVKILKLNKIFQDWVRWTSVVSAEQRINH